MDELSVLESVEAGQAPASAARSVKDIPLGITRGMASDDYHAERSAVSSSQLKRMLVSPAHFMCGLNEPEESTEAMLFGTVLHGRMLESDSFTERFFAAYFSPSWTAFQADGGRDFSVIVDGVSV